MGTNLDVAAADQSRPSATRTARPIHPMRCIFIPHLGKIGLAYFSPSECEVAHASRGINGGRTSALVWAGVGASGFGAFTGHLREASMGLAAGRGIAPRCRSLVSRRNPVRDLLLRAKHLSLLPWWLAQVACLPAEHQGQRDHVTRCWLLDRRGSPLPDAPQLPGREGCGRDWRVR